MISVCPGGIYAHRNGLQVERYPIFGQDHGVECVIVAVPPLRTAFELMPLSPLWYAAIFLVALVCLLLVRAAWRGRWLEQFLEIEP